MTTISQAMVLAAGLGTRMSPLTRTRPKPALPVLNRPLIGHLLDYLASQGVTFVVVNSHHLADRLEAAATSCVPPGMTLEFSRETKQVLGTGGGLRNAARLFEDGPLFLVNSDSLTDANLTDAARAHAASRRVATMVVREHDPKEGYRPIYTHPLSTDGSGTEEVSGLAGRRWGGKASTPRTFTGIHVLNSIAAIGSGLGEVFDIVADSYTALLDSKPGSIGAWLHSGWWFEAGTPARYLDLNMRMLARSGRAATVGPGFFIDEEAKVENAVIGAGARLEGNCRIEESVLWEESAVGAGTHLRRCIVTDGMRVPEGVSYENAILMRGEQGGLTVEPLGG